MVHIECGRIHGVEREYSLKIEIEKFWFFERNALALRLVTTRRAVLLKLR